MAVREEKVEAVAPSAKGDVPSAKAATADKK
jgi:hypothetical protein